MSTETRNFALFVVLSCLIVFGYDKYFGKADQVSITSEVGRNAEPKDVAQNVVVEDNQSPILGINIPIRSQNIVGSMSSSDSRISDISLVKYKQTQDENSECVKLLSENTYSAEVGWITNNAAKVPTKNTVWRVNEPTPELTIATPITMSYDNGDGIVFEKTYSIDKDYAIYITQKVTNNSSSPLSVKPFARIVKKPADKIEAWQTSYEGPLGMFNGKLEEIDYKKIDEKRTISFSSKGSWAGITEKYWLVSFIPDPQQWVNVRFYKQYNSYTVDIYHEEVIVKPGTSVETKQRLFVGAKEINILDKYEEQFNVKNFDLAIDFGYLYFLTKPLLYILSFTRDHIGNLGVGILLLTVILRLLLFPLANKSYRSMNRMRDVQPKIKAIQDRYADDKMKLGQELSNLYKKEKINPAGGCLPMLLQMPILFALYKVLYISIDMRHAPFFGWIHDLSAPDSMYILNLFGLIPVDLPGFLQIGIWPILMGLSMWIQQKMSPQVSDQAQAKMMMIVMPVMFTWMFAGLPSGLVIYWTWSNILGMIQQYAIMKIDAKKGGK